jgi:ParB/RepB/Spo0J family partition protein
LNPVIGQNSPSEKNQIGDFCLIETARIRPNPYNIREKVDSEKLKELSNSIREHGQVVPIKVRPANNDEYEIVYGYRRWLACKMALLPNVKCFVEKVSDDKVLADSIIENLQRECLSAIEEAKGYQILREKLKYSTYSIADAIGKSEAYVVQRLHLLGTCPDFQELIEGVDEILSDEVLPPEPSNQLKLGLTREENAKLLSVPKKRLPVSTASKILEKVKDTRNQLKIGKVIAEHKLTQTETDKFLKQWQKNPQQDLNKLAHSTMNGHAIVLDISRDIFLKGSYFLVSKCHLESTTQESIERLLIGCLELGLEVVSKDEVKYKIQYEQTKDGKFEFKGISKTNKGGDAPKEEVSEKKIEIKLVPKKPEKTAGAE